MKKLKRFKSVVHVISIFSLSLTLPINLFSLPGRNGLNVNVSLNDNSNVHRSVDVRNKDTPTGTHHDNAHSGCNLSESDLSIQVYHKKLQ